MISVNFVFWNRCNKIIVFFNVIVYFLLGVFGDYVFMDYYFSENEDFVVVDFFKLDIWVFDKVKVSLG